MKIRLLIFTFLCSVLSWGQVTIVTQDFETVPAAPTLTFANAGGVFSTGTNPAAGRPASANLFTSGARGWQVLNGTSTVTFANQLLAGYTNSFIEFKLAGMSTNATNGIDAADLITVSISVDGGTTYSSELTIGGSAANQFWSFAASGTTTTTYDGNNTPIPVTSTSATGVSSVRIDIPNVHTQVRVRVTMLNNAAEERWVIDDLRVRGTLASSNTIATSAITGSPFCVTTVTGASVSVPFTSVGVFSAGNVYTAQLSNAAGNFTTPINIGTLTSTANTGTITATIPPNTPTGTGYKIRVVSNNPIVTGTETAAFTINLSNVNTTPSTTQNIAVGANGTLLTGTEASTAVSRQWYYGTVSGGPYGTAISGETGLTYTPNFAVANTYYVVCVSTFACGSTTSNQVQINVVSGGSNDLCGFATPVVINAAPIAGTLTGSTFTAPFAKKDVWYTFTPTCTGTHDITVSGFTGDVDIELFSVSCPATTTTIDGSAGTTSTETISSALSAGTTYYLRILAFNVAAETANFNVSVTSTSELLLTNIGSPATGNILMGTANAVVMGFMTSPNCATSYDLTSVTLTKSVVSTATTADISNFRIFYDANSNGIIDGVEASISGAGVALGNTMAFTLSGQTGLTTVRRYLLVADVSATATNGRTIKVNITPNSDLIATLTPSGTKAGTALGNTQTIVPPVCTSAVISSVTPASGPVGTEVTFTASSGNLTGAVITFNGVAATVVSSSTTQLVAIIPAGATTGNVVITDAQPCNVVIAYTVIKSDNTSCEGSVSGSFTDLIISEIYDTQAGNGMYLELFNPTASPIVVNAASPTYRIGIDNDNGSGVLNGINRIINITGTVPAGGVIIYNMGNNTLSESPCTSVVTVDFFGPGVNERDAVYLLKNGTVLANAIDVVITPNETGFTLRRLPTAVGPTTTFNTADWSTLSAEECPDLGFAPAILGTPPSVSTQPTYTPSCGATSATLTTLGAQGFAGGLGLVYEWFQVAPGSSTWTSVTIAGNFADTDANPATLNIASITGIINYQYYCRIKENTATCFVATNAIKISDTAASTWNGTTWVGGTPTITIAAIIDGTYVTATHGNFSCCSLTVNTGVGRSLTISSNGFVEVQNGVTNNGTLDVLNNGSLVQIDDSGVNTGNIFVKRTSNVRLQDYSFWSSPISSATKTAIFPITSVSPATPTSVIWKWGPTSLNLNGGKGMWLNTTENMEIAKGYAVRGPSGTSNAVTTPLNVNFVGVPNNGVIPITISRGDDLNAGSAGPNGIMRTIKDDNYNLIGNPYPSAIDADLFIARYGVLASPDFADIEGSVRIWSHNTLPLPANANPFYATYQSNYAATNYITYNSMGSQTGPFTYNGKIPSGQGFFVLMLDGAVGNNTINFRNALRSKTFDNSQFYRTANPNAETSINAVEKHRVWLDLVSPINAIVRTLFGYGTGATNQLDNTFDATTDAKTAYNLYSIVDNEVLTIQGRQLPFKNNDKVQLGVKVTTPGLHKIAIAAVDGLFHTDNGGQKIYIEDKELNVIHDLTQNPYEFYGFTGEYSSRFVIRYTAENALSNEDFNSENEVIVVSNDELSVQSTKEKITSIKVYDVLGRKLYDRENIESTNFTLPIAKRKAPIIIKIGFQNGTKTNKKVVF